jgi:hypothetical protein
MSDAQQTKKAQSAKPAQNQSGNGPSLQETLDFLSSVVQSDSGQNYTQFIHNSAGGSSTHVENTWTLQSQGFPTVILQVQTKSSVDRDSGAGSFTYSLDLRRVDPNRIRVEKWESIDQGDGWTMTPHVVYFYVILEGTNNQQFMNLVSSSGDFSSSSALNRTAIAFGSEDTANRVAKAMKRAVELEGGKPSAF